MKIPKKEVLREAQEHPELVQRYGIGIAEQLAKDRHRKPKTTTKAGKNLYQKNLMRRQRLLKKGMTSDDFNVVWQSIFGNQKNKPQVNYNWNKSDGIGQ